MDFIIKTSSEELKRAQKWWRDLEMQWKLAYNEACFGKGSVLEPPKDDELMILLIRADTFRFAGPMAMNSNMTTKLTNLSGMIPLYHIHYLSISHTNITSLKDLKRHTKIEHLFVQENKLTSLRGIEGMTNLKELYCQNNAISDLYPVNKLSNLETLYVSNNKLTNLNAVTEAHSDNMKKFYVLPNEGLKDRDIIKFQNSVGIICRKG